MLSFSPLLLDLMELSLVDNCLHSGPALPPVAQPSSLATTFFLSFVSHAQPSSIHISSHVLPDSCYQLPQTKTVVQLLLSCASQIQTVRIDCENLARAFWKVVAVGLHFLKWIYSPSVSAISIADLCCGVTSSLWLSSAAPPYVPSSASPFLLFTALPS